MSFWISESRDDDEVVREWVRNVEVQTESTEEECLLNIFLTEISSSRLKSRTIMRKISPYVYNGEGSGEGGVREERILLLERG